MLVQALERDISQFGKQRDGHIKAAQKKLKTAKAEVEKAKQTLKAAQQRLNEVLAEAEAAASESSTLTEQIKSAQAAIAGAIRTHSLRHCLHITHPGLELNDSGLAGHLHNAESIAGAAAEGSHCKA